jgi:hypothetical protein
MGYRLSPLETEQLPCEASLSSALFHADREIFEGYAATSPECLIFVQNSQCLRCTLVAGTGGPIQRILLGVPFANY